MKTLVLTIIYYFTILYPCFSQEISPVEDSLKAILENYQVRDTTRVNILMELVGEVRFHDIDAAMVLAKEGEEIARETGSQMHLGKTYYYISLLNYLKGYLNIARKYALETVSLFEAEQHPLRISLAYNILGVINTDLRKDDEAISNIRRSLEIVEKLDDGIGQVQALANIGTIYLNRGDRDLARQYFTQALDVSEKYKFYDNQPELYLNLAGTAENFEKSDTFYSLSEEGFRKANMPYGIANVYLSKAINLVKRKRYTEALGFNKKALEIMQNSNFTLLEAKGYYEMANTYLQLNDLAEAEKAATKAKELALENKANETILNAYEILTEIYQKQGNLKAALENLKAYDQQKETIYNEKEAQFIAENEAKYQGKKKDIELEEKSLELARQKIQKNKIILGAGLLLLTIAGILGTLYYRQQKRSIISENELYIKKLEANNLREKEQIKSAFFANISHEFRTPLTLIVTPVRELIQGNFTGNLEKLYVNIFKNGERLLTLVNQLLELSKLESGNLHLNKEEADINGYIKSLAATFQSMAEVRDITFELNAPQGEIIALFDKNQLHKIISNLLSNAFKFTPDFGKVSLEINADEKQLTLSITDNGLGIEKKAIKYVFDRFYQSDTSNSANLMGSGIGLALTKELVELHDGTIEVQSEVNEGSTFLVQLPILKNESSKALHSEYISHAEINDPVEIRNAIETKKNEGKLPLLLIVEDNHDVSQLIKESLENHFEFLMATNGKTGLKMAQEHIPDVIISDVMMPEMDGYEFCKATKTNRLTSHIPVVMLTALADQKDKMQGIETGADAYLSKPFEIGELRLRLQKLMELRENLRQSYSKSISLRPEEIKVSSVDQKFMQTVNSKLEENLSNENFGVAQLADELALSKKQLNKKLKAILNQSANEIIRNYRLEKAHQMLAAKATNPTEASYQFGFSSPAYFSKCFSDRYGYPPSRLSEEGFA